MVVSNSDGETDPSGLAQNQYRVRHIWALAVGIVVCGQYFGWNGGLKHNGPIAMLIASLLVCLLFTGWVLTLSELAVAMPTAGGPMDYGTRAGGRWLGFLMGWSMFLECLFGGVATALASGGYIAFLLRWDDLSPYITVAAGLAVILIFFVVQTYRVREQAGILTLMIYTALLGLAIFWVASASGFRWERIWTNPVLPEAKGWGAVIDAVPFALWWLIIIEGAALAGEETHDPRRTLPHGLTWAVLTVTVMVVLTLVMACGAHSAQELGDKKVAYPLAEVIQHVPNGATWLIFFLPIAVFGLIASYHGLLYGASRQLFALGRAGFMPGALGRLNPRRQTPVLSVMVCSLIAACFVVSSLIFEESIMTLAVLVAGFAALVLYVLTMLCLLSLRRKNPSTFHAYRAPLSWGLPAAVIVLSLFVFAAYPRIGSDGLLLLSCGVYAVGILYFALNRRRGDSSRVAKHNAVLTDNATTESTSGSGKLGILTGALLTITIAVSGCIAFVGSLHADLFVSNAFVVTVLVVICLAVVLLGMLALRRIR